MSEDRTMDERDVLRQRADALARPVERREEAGESVEILGFSMSGVRYAVKLEHVEAAAKIGEIFSIPQTPPHISGIIRRHGRVLTLVDLQRFFRTDMRGIVDADIALVLRAAGKTFAIQADDIHGVARLPLAALLPVPDSFDRNQARFVTGVTADGLIVLDPVKLVEADGFGARKPTT